MKNVKFIPPVFLAKAKQLGYNALYLTPNLTMELLFLSDDDLDDLAYPISDTFNSRSYIVEPMIYYAL